MRIGIVCEGIHDFPALAVLVRDLALQAGLGEVSCDPLQPAADASSRSGDGGWSKVLAWCKANSGSGLDTFLNAPLFEGEAVYDAILIHLDGDIFHDCATMFKFTVPDPLSVDDRVNILSDLIISWLAPIGAHASRVKTAIPTQKTESWMLAAISTNEHDWEGVEAKSMLLFETGFGPGQIKADHYKSISIQLSGSIKKICDRCRSFELFAQQFQ